MPLKKMLLENAQQKIFSLEKLLKKTAPIKFFVNFFIFNFIFTEVSIQFIFYYLFYGA